MRTVDVEVFSYAELSPRAQQAVRQQWVEHVPKEEWADWVEDGFKTRVFRLGFQVGNVYFSGFGRSPCPCCTRR